MPAHELVEVLQARGLDLHAQLREMLEEHHSHRSERRGCGYTQATRLLAQQTNLCRLAPLPRSRVFAGHLDAATLASRMRAQARELIEALRLPESRLLAGWLRDLVLRDAVGAQFPRIAAEPLKVGSCPLAEQYFLEIAYRHIRRGGRVNLIVGAEGAPLLIEKRGLGDEHSCVNVAALVVHGVRIPPGGLFAVDYPEEAQRGLAPTRSGAGLCIPIAAISGARLLRLTTLAVAPEDRARAFSAHFEQQLASGLYSPERTRIEQLAEYAQAEAG